MFSCHKRPLERQCQYVRNLGLLYFGWFRSYFGIVLIKLFTYFLMSSSYLIILVLDKIDSWYQESDFET